MILPKILAPFTFLIKREIMLSSFLLKKNRLYQEGTTFAFVSQNDQNNKRRKHMATDKDVACMQRLSFYPKDYMIF